MAGVIDSSGKAVGIPQTINLSHHLAIQPLSGILAGWSVVLLDRDGRTIEELVAGEKRMYLMLVAVTALVMLGGIVITIRAASHEMETARLKTEFVSNVSHELKTPLSLIRMFSDTLDSDVAVNESERKDFMGIIRRESERLTLLINNILDFSRIDAGKREYHKRSIDLGDLVRRTIDNSRYRLQEEGFLLATDIPENPVWVEADPDAVMQALLNLVDNAIKYSEEKKEISVGVKEEGEKVLIIVRDKGVGIPARDIPHLFERFFRGSSPRTKETRGTGIGLSIARGMIESQGGTIVASSSPFQGSTFTIALPLWKRND